MKKSDPLSPEPFPKNPPRRQLAAEYRRLWREFKKQAEDTQLIMALSDRYFKKLKQAKDLIEKKQRENESLLNENQSLQAHLISGVVRNPEAFKEIITRDKKMISIFQYLEAVASSSEPILIMGETGTGKELIAQAVHRLSRPHESFIAINVASLDDQMFADALFGHLKGAFTDARAPRRGLIEETGSGTLFLDEIGDLSPASQVKLLRLLQEHDYFPLGSDRPRVSRARIICSTNKDFEQSVSKGQFREDLYYRLRTHWVRIPPLRERHQDIPLLIDHFASAAATEMGKKMPALPALFVQRLSILPFRGNVRELRSLVYDAVAADESGRLLPRPFREAIQAGRVSRADATSTMEKEIQLPSSLPSLREMRQLLIAEALRRCGGRQSQAAALLGITRQSLNKYLKKQR